MDFSFIFTIILTIDFFSRDTFDRRRISCISDKTDLAILLIALYAQEIYIFISRTESKNCTITFNPTTIDL